jgi:6-phosphogluconate dehydrogenase
VIEAQQMGVPATVIEAAVAARSLSSFKDERVAAAGLYRSPAGSVEADRAGLTVALEQALFAGKIVSYAQGFAVMKAASAEFGWELPMPAIARIWRAGCIIRSQFLDTIAEALTLNPGTANLLVEPYFIRAMQDCVPGLRRVVALAAGCGLPVPALSAALAYFESYRQARGTANLIQAQRDFFGEHGFERTDRAGAHHGPWAMTRG